MSEEKRLSDLIYHRKKLGRGCEYKIYNDKALEIKSTFGSTGLTLSTELFEWFKLPRKKSDTKINLISTYECIKSADTIILFEKIESVISNNGYSTTIKPIDLTIKKEIKKSKKVCCTIHGEINGHNQLKMTIHLEKIIEIFNKSNVLLVNDKSQTRIVSGEQQNTRFDIYKTNDGTIIIENKGKLSSKGTFEFSDNISDYVELWHEKINYVTATIDGKKSMILKITSGVRDTNRKIKYAYVNNDSLPRDITIKITSPELKLTNKALYDANLFEIFQKSGYNIRNVRTDYRDIGRHHNPNVESNIRDIISESYRDNPKLEILNEVEITFDDRFNKIGNKHIFDVMVIEFDKRKNITSIITIEIKSSIGKSSTSIIQDTIYECLHFERKFEKNITSLIFSYKNFNSNKIYNFAEQNGVILIDKSTYTEIKNGKLNLKTYVKLFESNIKNNQYPQNLRFNGFENNENAGSNFEKEVKKLLENDGYSVVSNAVFYLNKQKIEIDLIARKDDENIIVSCRDAKDISDKVSLKKIINKRANKIEHRRILLVANSARLYVKTNFKLKEDLKQLYENNSWVDNVNIYII